MSDITLKDIFINYGHVRKGDIVLDVGTGFGWATIALAEIVYPQGKVYTVDPSETSIRNVLKSVEKTKLKGLIIGKVASAEKLPFENNFFDKVVTAYSFHHFSDRIKAIREMARVCKKSGLILIVEWKPESGMHPHPPHVMPSKKDIINSIKANGFKIELEGEDRDRYIIGYKNSVLINR